MPVHARERNRKSRERKKEQGLVRKEVWILPEHSEALKITEGYLRFESFDVDMLKSELMGISY